MNNRVFLRTMMLLTGVLLFSGASQAVVILEGPTLTMNPATTTPLAGRVDIITDVPVQVQLTITSGADTRQVTFPDAAAQNSVPVLGMKPDRTYSVTVDLIPGGFAGTLMATTDPLPADFPTLVTLTSVPTSMEPGYTLLSCMRRGPNPEGLVEYTAIVDAAGEVVWYTNQCFAAGKQLVNGNILYRGGASAVEYTLLGQIANEAILEDTGSGLHHDLQRTPHGTYLSLSRLATDVPDFPTSETDPNAPTATTTVRDEPVVEFFPDGTLRREWRLLDMLDRDRIGYDSLRPTSAGVDWAHDNAVTYNPIDDSIVVSIRHQDAVIKFSRETGDLQWILGPHDNWSPEFQQYLLNPVGTPFLWQFHQHAPMWTDYGTLVLFDNGNWKASPFDGTERVLSEDNFSRGVEFDIDEGQMQVEQVWEYGENTAERLYAFFIGDADWLPITGNRLMTFGGTSHVDGVASADMGMGGSHTRIIETTDDLVAVKVFDLQATASNGDQINVYRSERIVDLYPQVYMKIPNVVGDTLRVDKEGDDPDLSWDEPLDDADHDPAEWYIVYHSTTADAGFSIRESTAFTDFLSPSEPDPMEFFVVVAANTAGTSGEEPLP